MAETLAWNFVGDDQLSKLLETLDRVAGKLDRTFNSLGDQATQAGRKLGVAGAEAKGAGDELKGVGDDAAKAGRKIDELGDDMDKAALKAVVFEAQMRLAKRSVKELTDEFVKTGDVDILKKLGNSQSHLAGLEKEFKKTFEHVAADAEKAGQEAGKTLTASLQGTLKTPMIGPALTAVLVAGAIAAAPAIGAAVGSAVTLGVGGGALAAGIFLASKDARVHQAWSDFGKSAMDELTAASNVFVAPLLASVDRFRGAFDQIMPSIRGDFAYLAPLVDKLSAGVSGFVTNAMPGVDRLVETAGPFIRDLADELPNLGNAVKDFFDSVSAGGPGAKQFFHDMLVLTEKTVVGVGNTIEFLSRGYAGMSGVSRIMRGDVTGALILWDQFGDKGPKVMHDFRDAAAGAVAAVHRLQIPNADAVAKTVDRLMGSMLGMGHATLGVAESITGLQETFKGIGPAIDSTTGQIAMNTQAGQRQREAVLSAIEANLRQYDAMIASGKGADEATAKYDQNTKALHDQLRQAGLTEAQVSDLIGEYGKVPGKVNTALAVNGLTQAIENLDDLMHRINNIPTRKDIYVTQHLSSVGSFYQSPDRLFDYPGAAYGGRAGKRAMGGGVYDVGENGPERVVLPDDAYVIPNNQMSRGAGGSGSSDEILGAVRIEVSGPNGTQVRDALLRLARGQGKSVAQTLTINV